jgi:hypothetical protein
MKKMKLKNVNKELAKFEVTVTEHVVTVYDVVFVVDMNDHDYPPEEQAADQLALLTKEERDALPHEVEDSHWEAKARKK